MLCRYPGPGESVHIKLLVSPVSFSHNNVRLLMVYGPYELTARLAVSEINGQTDGQTELSLLLFILCTIHNYMYYSQVLVNQTIRPHAG